MQYKSGDPGVPPFVVENGSQTVVIPGVDARTDIPFSADRPPYFREQETGPTYEVASAPQYTGGDTVVTLTGAWQGDTGEIDGLFHVDFTAQMGYPLFYSGDIDIPDILRRWVVGLDGDMHDLIVGAITDHNDLDGRDASGAHPISAISGLQEALDQAITEHNDLGGRSESDAHPIAAITGLQAALDAKFNAVDAGDLATGDDASDVPVSGLSAPFDSAESVQAALALLGAAAGRDVGTGPEQVPTNDMLGDPSRTVATIAELREIEATDLPVYVLGYYEPGDGGGGEFYWDASSEEPDNGGTIVKAGGVGVGRWKRIHALPIDLRAFGVIAGGSREDHGANNRDALVAALAAVKSVALINSGERYYFYGVDAIGGEFNGCSFVGLGNPVYEGRINVSCRGFTVFGIVFDGAFQSAPTNQHLIWLREGGDYTVRGCTFRNLRIGTAGYNGSDGIYINVAGDQNPEVPGYRISNVLIDNCKFIDLSRQAVSILRGENISIQNCYSSTRRAFVDVEPNNSYEWARGIYVRDSLVDGKRVGVTYVDDDGNELDDINGQGFGLEFHNVYATPPNHNYACSAENVVIIGSRSRGAETSQGIKMRQSSVYCKNIYCEGLAGSDMFEVSGAIDPSKPIQNVIEGLYLVDSGTPGSEVFQSYLNASFSLIDSVLVNVDGYFRGEGFGEIRDCKFINCGQGESAFLRGYSTRDTHPTRELKKFNGNLVYYTSGVTPPTRFVQEPRSNFFHADTVIQVNDNTVINKSGTVFLFFQIRNMAQSIYFSRNMLDGVRISYRADSNIPNRIHMTDNIISLSGDNFLTTGDANAQTDVAFTSNHYSGGSSSSYPMIHIPVADHVTLSTNQFMVTNASDGVAVIGAGVNSLINMGNVFRKSDGVAINTAVHVDGGVNASSGLNIDRI